MDTLIIYDFIFIYRSSRFSFFLRKCCWLSYNKKSNNWLYNWFFYCCTNNRKYVTKTNSGYSYWNSSNLYMWCSGFDDYIKNFRS